MASPTARSLKLLRKEGWEAGVVEKTIPKTFIKRDLFGLHDIIAIKDCILGVQATSDSNIASHVAKAFVQPLLRNWLLAGGRFEIWGWSKKGPRGKVKHWKVRKVIIELVDDEPSIVTTEEDAQ